MALQTRLTASRDFKALTFDTLNKFKKPAILIGFILGISVIGAAGINAANNKFCRPVMPEIVVNLTDGEMGVQQAELILIYIEKLKGRMPAKETPKGYRISHCRAHDTECIGSRARFEFRPEASRTQAIRVLGMGDTGREGRSDSGNPIVGNVQWHGEAYPRRVTLDCDLGNLDVEAACAVAKIENDLPQSMLHWSSNSQFDQCLPNSFSTSSMLSFTQVGRP